MLFEAGVHGTAALVPHLFDFSGVVLVFKPTVISVVLAFMLVSACVALFAYIYIYIGADACAGWELTCPVGIGVGVCFGVGASASSCACVCIDVAIGVVVGVDGSWRHDGQGVS